MSKNTALLFLFVVVCAVSFGACQPTTRPAANESTPPASAAPAAAQATASPTTSASPSAHVMLPGETKVTTEGTYTSPAGEEKVGFTVYVDKDGVVTDAETAVLAKNPTSVTRQTTFAKEFATTLKGKKLSELTKVDRIGGSSLTTGAFNKSLTELKAQL